MPQPLAVLRALRFLLLDPRGRGDRGATAVEYGLMVTLIVVAVVGVIFLLSDNVSNLFSGLPGDAADPGGR